MMLVVSLLVLLLSILSAPALLAFRVKNSYNQKTPNSNSEPTILTARNDLYAISSDEQDSSSSLIRNKISYLNSLLNNHELYGSWQASNVDEFNINQQGYSSLRYAEDYNAYEESMDMALCLYNGFYTNTNYSCVSFSEYIPFIPVTSFNEGNMTLNFNQIIVHMANGAHNEINQLGNECSINCSIYFTDRNTKTPFIPSYNMDTDKDAFTVQFEIQSLDCGLNLITTEMIPEDEPVQVQASNYSVVMSVAAIFQCLLCYAFTNLFEQNKNICQRISQGSLRIINAFDLFIALQCFFRVTTSFSIGFTAIPYLILAVYFEPKMIRSVKGAQGDLKERGFRGLSVFNFAVLLVSAFIAILSAIFQKPEWMIMLFCFHQFPQILQNYKTQRKYRWTECLVFLFVLPKLAYIAYILVFPRSLFRTSPDNELALVFTNILVFQLLILLLQRRYPMLCAKRKAVYQSFMSYEKKDKEEVCSVCLENFEPTSPASATSTASTASATSTASNGPLLKAKSVGDTKMIMTPCNHHFHECCLRDWTKLKAVCPYCRFSLPPLPEEEDY